MKPFNLTKQMKAELALKLTILAVKDNIPEIERAMNAINQEFWDTHVKRVEVETDLSADKFDHLIQAGIMTGVSFCKPTFNEGKQRFTRTFDKYRMGKPTFQAKLMEQREFKGLYKHFFMNCQHHNDCLHFNFSTDHTVPRMNQMENVGDRPGLLKAINDVCDRLETLLNAAAEFHEQTEMVLLPMRTSRQLLDAFPEAAKLLPEPVKVTHEMAPIDQINRVREMLKAGVPPQPMGTC